MPGILSVLSRDEAVALTDLAGACAGRGSARQRRVAGSGGGRSGSGDRDVPWLAAAVAVAAALAIVGGVVGATRLPARAAPVQTVAMAPMQPGSRGGLTAQLAVTEKKWGTELNWACEYTKDWSRNVDSYDIVVTTKDGEQTAVGSWSPRATKPPGCLRRRASRRRRSAASTSG